jgi:hypothetical protein
MSSLWYAASAVQPYALTADRIIASVAALVSVAGAIAGVLALVRRRKPFSTTALVAGLVGLLGGVYILATADGGPGTGNGVVGGYAAVALGVVAGALGGLAMARSRRTA